MYIEKEVKVTQLVSFCLVLSCFKMIWNESSIANVTDIKSVTGITTTGIILLLIWVLIVIVLGIGGNGLVLIGSLKYKALSEMDKISVFLMECVAAIDMAFAVCVYIPMMITIIANRWVLGGVYCVFQSIAVVVLPATEVILIATTAAYRCYLVANPFAVIPEINCFRKV